MTRNDLKAQYRNKFIVGLQATAGLKSLIAFR
jgi:hypothetical protein